MLHDTKLKKVLSKHLINEQFLSIIVNFRSFQTIYRIETVDFRRIRTRIVKVEDGHADHLTTLSNHFVILFFDLPLCRLR